MPKWFKDLPKPVQLLAVFFVLVFIATLLSGCVAQLPANDCPEPLVEHPGKDNTSCIKPGMKVQF